MDEGEPYKLLTCCQIAADIYMYIYTHVGAATYTSWVQIVTATIACTDRPFGEHLESC